jgi:hypothetical protein
MLAPAAHAQGASGPNTQAAPGGIDEAKRDFERSKSAPDAGGLPAGLPRLQLPELPSPAPPATSPRPAAPARDGKSATWLLDAMAKPEGARDQRGVGPRIRDSRAPSRTSAHSSPPGRDESPRSAPNGDSASERPADATFATNPLTRYLADWMTPQDYALLKPGLTETFDSRATRNDATGLGLPEVTFGRGLGDLAPGGRSSPLSLNPVSPGGNPYLEPVESLAPVQQSLPGSRAQSPPTLAPVAPLSKPPASPTITAPPPVPASPSPTGIPEFATPPIDDRYFKQLKRF